MAELTGLLHRSFGTWADRGIRFLASGQSEDVTRQRVADGECYVAVADGRLLATITVKPPGCGGWGGQWYARPEVAGFGQLAVLPELQQGGLGAALIGVAEERARALGATELALDTAEGALPLVGYYRRRGYRPVAFAQWRHANYRSLILSKPLGLLRPQSEIAL
ncbi:MAG TPA: GNAT family N-acetyltransferase [Alphaproteobacteria bacterium]|nr:GNAT family N-acetyltransferase [Alphaproteobacteria bacterium]